MSPFIFSVSLARFPVLVRPNTSSIPNVFTLVQADEKERLEPLNSSWDTVGYCGGGSATGVFFHVFFLVLKWTHTRIDWGYLEPILGMPTW